MMQSSSMTLDAASDQHNYTQANVQQQEDFA